MHAVDGGAGALGDGRVKQVRSDGGRRMDAEQQDEQGRHQRAAADTGDADQRSHEKTGERIKRIEVGEHQIAGPKPTRTSLR